MDIWISTTDISDVGLEMLDIDAIEADDCGVETDIGLCDVFSEVEGAF